jgi:hypothetical protein
VEGLNVNLEDETLNVVCIPEVTLDIATYQFELEEVSSTIVTPPLLLP